MERLLGRGNFIGIDLKEIESRFGTGAVYGTRLAGSSDMSFLSVDEPKTFKKMTGGDSLFAENRKYGLKVTTIQPDMTYTELYRHANFEQGEEPESYLKPEQIAEAVNYILTQDSEVVIPKITLQPQIRRIRRK